MKNKLNPTQIAVILPAFNEATTIKQCILDFHKALPGSPIWVINNNSTDETEAIAQDIFKNKQFNGGIINESRQGKGNALRAAFNLIDADYYVLCDSDQTYPASITEALLKALIENEADMVVGDRHSSGNYAASNDRSFHSLGNWLVKSLVNQLFKSDLKDIMSGLRVFTKQFVKNYSIMVEGFEVETDMTLHALDKRLNIVEVPIEYKVRPCGSYSKLNTFSDGTKVIFTIFRILRYYKPLVFFGILAFIFSFLSISAGIPVIYEWLLFDQVLHIPLAILATGLQVIAVLLLAVGLILDSISYAYHRDLKLSLDKNCSLY